MVIPNSGFAPTDEGIANEQPQQARSPWTPRCPQGPAEPYARPSRWSAGSFDAALPPPGRL